MVLMILSDPYINSFNDVGGSMSRGNIGPKPYLTNTPPTGTTHYEVFQLNLVIIGQSGASLGSPSRIASSNASIS
jgi:hypothetical protein